MPDRSRRSSARGQGQAVQHIEVMTPDDPTWWDDAPVDSTVTTPPSRARQRARRRLVVGGLITLAMAAAVTGAVLSDDDDTDSDSPVAAVGHFVIDGPGLRPYSADIVTPLPSRARYTLFASGNPTNPWISLQTYRQRGVVRPLLDSSRREVNGRNLITPRDERSMTTIVVDVGAGWEAEVRAFNVEDRELVQFVNALRVSDVAAGTLLVDEGILASNNLMSTRTTSWSEDLLFGTVETEMRAMTDDGALVTLRESMAEFDTRPATLAYFTTGLIEGSDTFTASTLTPGGESIVTWATAGRLLSLTGRVSTTELLSISRSVRLADAAEWRSLVYGLRPDYRLGEFAEVGSGKAADGSPWRSGIQLASRGERPEYLWWWTLPGTNSSDSAPAGVDLAAAAGNDTIVVGASTYVFVWVPAESVASEARVRAADGTEVQLELVQPFAGVPVRLATTRIDVPGAVEITTD